MGLAEIRSSGQRLNLVLNGWRISASTAGRCLLQPDRHGVIIADIGFPSFMLLPFVNNTLNDVKRPFRLRSYCVIQVPVPLQAIKIARARQHILPR